MSLLSVKGDQPLTELGRLRILSSTAGIRVSPLALGGGNIGQKWNNSWGYMDKEGAFKLLDAYYEVSLVSPHGNQLLSLAFAPSFR